MAKRTFYEYEDKVYNICIQVCYEMMTFDLSESYYYLLTRRLGVSVNGPQPFLLLQLCQLPVRETRS